MFYLSLFFYVFFFTVTTLAEVNKEFGEFRTTHKDSFNTVFYLERQYSSRSLFRGVFGFNWCSQLDFKLKVSRSEVSYYDCDDGKTVSQKKFVKDEWIIVERKTNSYYFNKDGRLSHWMTPQGPIYLIYNNGRMEQLLVPRQGRLKITYSPEGVIEKIGSVFQYTYQHGLLLKVLKNRKVLWSYQYDEFLNMTLWRGPSGSETMKYDSEWDRIVYLKDNENCKSEFLYTLKNRRKFILETKKCLNQAKGDSLFELVRPHVLIESPSDLLGKEFRQGANYESTF